MSLSDRIRRLAARYNPTLDWTQVSPTTHTTTTGDLIGRVIRRNGTWWLYTIRGDRAAKAVHLDHNITTAKRMAETALTETWLLDWPADQEGS